MDKLFKRTCDIIFAFFCLILLSPLLFLITVLVWVKMGRPILFRQQRPGLNGKPFVLYKFRTMTDERNSRGVLFSEEKRLTPFGRWLRKYSLDELPQLFNVLKGELSIVGPRPLLMAYLPLYDEIQARRHEVKPGMTGWAQVNGRNALSWEEKFALDVWYVDNRTFWLDIKIVWLTVKKVLQSEGVDMAGHHTGSPLFTGQKKVDHVNQKFCELK